MAYRIRFEIANDLYHVMSWGSGGVIIYFGAINSEFTKALINPFLEESCNKPFWVMEPSSIMFRNISAKKSDSVNMTKR